jgi:hypothetical protein
MVVGQQGKKFEGSHLDETLVVAKCAAEHFHESNQKNLVLADASDVQRIAWTVA